MDENINRWEGENPWLGLESYNEGQHLYGRDQEATELTDIILNHTAVVVYGKSGIGKSSLLRAGVFPELRKQDFIPIYVRLEHNSDISYTQQIENALSKDIQLHELLPNDMPDLGLWDFIHRHRFLDNTGCPVTPVIVLDQFEEIFTLTEVEYKSDARLLFNELANLLNDVKPEAVIQSEASAMQQHSEPLAEKSMGGFVLQRLNKSALNYDKAPSFRIVITIRDDSLYLLERNCAKIPSLKTNRFNLDALSESSAMDVIMLPRQGLISEAEGKEILDSLAYYDYDDFRVIDPAILSLFLYSYFNAQGEVSATDIFDMYYNNSISPIDVREIDVLENALLTERGSRIQIPAEDLLTAGVSSPSLNHLIQAKILKTERRKAIDYIEFTHDRICEQALKHRNIKRNIESQKKKDKKLGYSLGLGVLSVVVMVTILIFVASRDMPEGDTYYVDLEGFTWSTEDYTRHIYYLEDSLHNLRDSIANVPPKIWRDYTNEDNSTWSSDQYVNYIEALEDSIQDIRDSIQSQQKDPK